MNSLLIYRTIKRASDIGIASAGIFLTFPVVMAAAMAVLLDSGTPIVYRSRRVGRGGREFELLKLRTMTTRQSSLAPQVTSASDPRITRVGRWLRKTKIDELPQLWNVVVGDVSIVGPRPEVRRYVEHYPEQFSEILTIRPGLTDRTTLELLDEESLLHDCADPEAFYVTELMPKKIASYLEYVRHPSLLQDAQILVETIVRVGSRTLRR